MILLSRFYVNQSQRKDDGETRAPRENPLDGLLPFASPLSGVLHNYSGKEANTFRIV